MEPRSVAHTPQPSLFNISLFVEPFLPFFLHFLYPLLSGLRSFSFCPLKNLPFLFPLYFLHANSFCRGPCAEGWCSPFKLITKYAYIHTHSAVSDPWPRYLFILLHSPSSDLFPLISVPAGFFSLVTILFLSPHLRGDFLEVTRW